MMRQYWVSNAAHEHVKTVQEKGYTQVNMGPRAPLEKMNVGDWILYYSPTFFFEDESSVCQQFTGIACVKDQRIYPKSNKYPDHWRRNVDFFSCIAHHPKHFLGKVSFLPESSNWIEILNQAIFQIPQQDFLTIANTIVAPDEKRVLWLE